MTEGFCNGMNRIGAGASVARENPPPLRGPPFTREAEPVPRNAANKSRAGDWRLSIARSRFPAQNSSSMALRASSPMKRQPCQWAGRGKVTGGKRSSMRGRRRRRFAHDAAGGLRTLLCRVHVGVPKPMPFFSLKIFYDVLTESWGSRREITCRSGGRPLNHALEKMPVTQKATKVSSGSSVKAARNASRSSSVSEASCATARIWGKASVKCAKTSRMYLYEGK